MTTVQINVRNPRVYFVDFDCRTGKWVKRAGWYKGKTKDSHGNVYRQIQGTRFLYTKVAEKDFFGIHSAAAIGEAYERNRLARLRDNA
jgi:hypothetical protein